MQMVIIAVSVLAVLTFFLIVAFVVGDGRR
jgi:hypothetical protein